MTLMLLIAAGAVPAVALDQPSKAASSCPRTTSYHAFDRSKQVSPKKLHELPSANAYAAVYRRVNGCEVPVVVRYNLGGR